MSDATSGPLRDAYEAIRANQLPKAREVLRAYMVSQPNDPDVWWLYSYAAENADEARQALQNVLRLDPMYPGANDLLTQLNQSAGSGSSTVESSPQPASIRKLGDTPVAPVQTSKPEASFDDEDFDDLDDLDEDDDDDSGFTRRRVLLALGGFALIVALIVLVFFFLPRRTSAPEATSVAQVTPPDATLGITVEPSLEATTMVVATISPEPSLEVDVTATVDVSGATQELVATEDGTSLETPAATEFDTFYGALGAFEVVPDSIAIEQTTLGSTLSGSVCLQNQGELRSAIPDAISALASASPQAPAEAQFVGVKFLNCADNSLMRYVAVSIEDARAFAAGTLTAAELRSGHRNITR